MKYKLVAVLVFFFCFTTLSYTGYGKPTTTVVKIGIGGAKNCGGCGLISQNCPSGLKCCWGDVSPLIQVSPNTYQGLWIVGSSKFRYSECNGYGNCGYATLHFYKDPVGDCLPEMNMLCIDPEELNEVLVVTVPVVVMGSQAFPIQKIVMHAEKLFYNKNTGQYIYYYVNNAGKEWCIFIEEYENKYYELITAYRVDCGPPYKCRDRNGKVHEFETIIKKWLCEGFILISPW